MVWFLTKHQHQYLVKYVTISTFFYLFKSPTKFPSLYILKNFLIPSYNKIQSCQQFIVSACPLSGDFFVTTFSRNENVLRVIRAKIHNKLYQSLYSKGNTKLRTRYYYEHSTLSCSFLVNIMDLWRVAWRHGQTSSIGSHNEVMVFFEAWLMTANLYIIYNIICINICFSTIT